MSTHAVVAESEVVTPEVVSEVVVTPVEESEVVTLADRPPESPGLVRYIVIGSLVGMTLAFVAVAAAMVVAGQGWGPGVGLGAFVAFWGGIGFGSMVGGVIYLSFHEED